MTIAVIFYILQYYLYIYIYILYVKYISGCHKISTYPLHKISTYPFTYPLFYFVYHELCFHIALFLEMKLQNKNMKNGSLYLKSKIKKSIYKYIFCFYAKYSQKNNGGLVSDEYFLKRSRKILIVSFWMQKSVIQLNSNW